MVIYLNLHTNGNVDGTYTFNTNSFNPNVDTWDGGYFINQDMSLYSQQMVFPISANSGIIVVTDMGGFIYDIQYTFTTTNGETITGCYYGSLNYYDTGGSGSSGSSGAPIINSLKINPKSW